jgi:hypothetical protein
MPPNLQVHWVPFCIGVALCLLGWTLYWFGLQLAGGLAGALFGAAAVWSGATFGGLPAETMAWLLPVAAVLGFVAGIFFARSFHRFVFFFAGATLGMAAGELAFEAMRAHVAWAQANPGAARAICLVVAALLGGLLMLRSSRVLVTLVSAVVGSALVVLSFAEPLVVLLFIPLAPASFLLQMGILRRLLPAPAGRGEDEEEEENKR